MNVYTDPRLLDVQGAVESLPEFSITNEPNENRQRIAAGAENLTFSTVAVPVAVTVAVPTDFSRDLQSTAVTYSAISSKIGESPEMQKTPGETMFPRSFRKGGQADLNRRPPDPQSGALTN